jgi:hypothetical protein
MLENAQRCVIRRNGRFNGGTEFCKGGRRCIGVPKRWEDSHQAKWCSTSHISATHRNRTPSARNATWESVLYFRPRAVIGSARKSSQSLLVTSVYSQNPCWRC